MSATSPVGTRGSRRVGRRIVRLVRANPFETIVGVVYSVYFAFALSPSSYGLALGFLGVTDTGTLLGHPRVERWDEWAVQTPYVQALVRSGFGTHNVTSYYHESFRNLMSLPVMDWGFAFRPLHWGYAFLPAAWAFSLYWSLAAALTLVGWSVLLRRWGLRYGVAVACSLSIFFAPFTQTWWSAVAVLLALFPWILLAASSRIRRRYQVPLVAWLVACCVVSASYPPWLLMAAFVGLVTLLAFVVRRDQLGRLALVGVGGLVGLGIGFLYISPALRALSTTSYPGHRVVAGGGLPWGQWLSQFTPLGVTRGNTSTNGTIVPEAVAMGSFLPLLALSLVDYRRLRERVRWPELRPVVALGTGFALLSLWQLFSAFGPLGSLFGWNRAEVQRSLLGSGLLLIVLAGWVLSRFPLRLTVGRFAAAVAVLVGASALTATHSGAPTFRYGIHDDLLAVAAVAVIGVGLVWWRGRRRPGWTAGAVALAAMLPVACVWVLYNPVQEAQPIFRPIHTPVTAQLDHAASLRPDHVIASGLPGAVANGAGYRSVVQTLVLPDVAAFARLFPDLSPAQLNYLFNRYLDMHLIDGTQPRLDGEGVIGLPTSVIEQHATIPGVNDAPSG
jgi:hypothetical protein